MKKLISVILSVCMMLALAVPAFASEDPAVQASYEAYLAIKEAMEARNLDALLAATDAFAAANEDLTDEQTDELWILTGEEAFVVIFRSAAIIGFNDIKNAFQTDPSVVTALDLVRNFDEYFGVGEEQDVASVVEFTEYMPDFLTAYEAAKAYLPKESVLEMYDICQNLADVLAWTIYDEDFVDAMNAFSDVMDAFIMLSEGDLAVLGSLLGVEDPHGYAMDNWFTAVSINEMGEAYYAFGENPDEETATNFVNTYDFYFNDPDFDNEQTRELLREFFYFLDETYTEACAVMNGEGIERPDYLTMALEAYENLLQAIADRDLEGVISYYNQVEDANWELTDKETEELMEKIGNGFFDNMFLASSICALSYVYEDFASDPSILTALDLKSVYNDVFNNDYLTEAEIQIVTETVPSIHDAYASALAMLPEQNVLSIYYAYTNLNFCVDFGFYDVDFVEAFQSFAAVDSAFKALSQEELAALSEMIDDDAATVIPAVYENAKIIHTFGEVYDFWLLDPSVTNAAPFVEVYENFFAEGALTQEQLELLSYFFENAAYDYEDALALLGDAPIVNPDTGDHTPVLLLTLVAAVSLSAAVALLKKREQF